MSMSVATERRESEPIDHPIVNHYKEEVTNDATVCSCDDHEQCEYEAD